MKRVFVAGFVAGAAAGTVSAVLVIAYALGSAYVRHDPRYEPRPDAIARELANWHKPLPAITEPVRNGRSN